MLNNEKYYDGFEGEPQITFCLVIDNVIVEQIGMWDGYFNEIMEQIKPSVQGWTGLAYYYHLYIGWYEEDNWLIPNVKEIYEQFKGINDCELTGKPEKELLNLILSLLKKAIDENGKVYIIYE